MIRKSSPNKVPTSTVKPMTIIFLQKQFKKFFNAHTLQKMAKSTGLMKRCRVIVSVHQAPIDRKSVTLST